MISINSSSLRLSARPETPKLSRAAASPVVERSAKSLGTGTFAPREVSRTRASSVATQAGQATAQLRAARELQALVATAQTGLSEQLDILQRMRAAVEPGTSSTWSTAEIREIEAYLSEIKQEFTAVGDSTQHEGTVVLDGSLSAAAYDLGGGEIVNLSLPAVNLDGLTVQPGGGGFYEAEDGVLNGFIVESDPATSGGQFLHTPNGTGSFKAITATYTFNNLQPGTYRLYGRIYSPNGNDNSFYIQMNDETRREVQFAYRSYYVNYNIGPEYELEAGDHTLTLHQREDGTRIDWLTLQRQDVSSATGLDGPQSAATHALSTIDDAISQVEGLVSTADSAVDRLEASRARALNDQEILLQQERAMASAASSRALREVNLRAMDSFYNLEVAQGGMATILGAVRGQRLGPTTSDERPPSASSSSRLSGEVHDFRKQTTLRAFGVAST